MALPAIPKLRMPLRFDGGRLAIVEQDSPENVRGAVFACLAYELGERIEDPDFGIEDPTFEETPLDTTEWIEAINRYEPRAEVQTSQDVEEFVDVILAEVAAA